MQLIALLENMTWAGAFFGSVVVVCLFFLILTFGGIGVMFCEDWAAKRRARKIESQLPGRSHHVANKTTTER